MLTIYKYDMISGKKNVLLALFEEKIHGIFTMEECVQFGVEIRNEWEERNGTQESTNDMKGLIFEMERVQSECLKIRSENRDLKIQLNVMKEETKKITE